MGWWIAYEETRRFYAEKYNIPLPELGLERNQSCHAPE